jgi:hypothetical protein
VEEGRERWRKRDRGGRERQGGRESQRGGMRGGRIIIVTVDQNKERGMTIQPCDVTWLNPFQSK